MSVAGGQIRTAEVLTLALTNTSDKWLHLKESFTVLWFVVGDTFTNTVKLVCVLYSFHLFFLPYFSRIRLLGDL